MREWLWRLKAMIRRDSRTGEITEELQLHLDMEIEAGLRLGLSPDEARRRARQRVGLVSAGMESTRDELGIHWLNGALSDLRHAFRALARNRGFGLVAISVLAISVAINTLIFFMLEGVILRPLPYESPKQLVRIYDVNPGTPKFPMAIGRFLDYRANAESLESIALYTGRDMELGGMEGKSKQLTGIAITPEYFSVLRTKPLMGRAFAAADTHGDVRNAIVSYRLWREQFQSDPAIIGKGIRLNRELWTVVGVTPAGFQHVGGDYRSPLQGETVDVWMPLMLDLGDRPLRAHHFCNAVARIRDGLTVAQARLDLERLAGLYNKHYPAYGEWKPRIEPLLSEVTGRSGQVVWLLAAAGGLVLLVACANIAGLCVARAVARRKELALRQALGANRWQLLRVGLAENLLVGFGGAALGLTLAGAGLPLLRQLLPADFPRAHEIALTWMGAAFATAIALATVLIAGLLPSNSDDTLQSQRVTTGRKSRRLRTVLVATEIALAGLLCAGALFLLRSYQQIGARDHGFHSAGTLTFQLSLPGSGPRKPGEIARVFEDIRSKIAAIPGVASVGASTNLPWSGYDENTNFGIVGQPKDNDNSPGARYQAATPGYFEATGMRLLSGRLFDPAKDIVDQPQTVIVNDALASRYFPAGNALGARLDFGKETQIVGIVGGIKDYPADLDVKPAFWFPEGQHEFDTLFFAVHTSVLNPANLTAAVSGAVQAVDPELPLADIRTLESRAGGALAARRFAMLLFQVFAGLALVLAAAGIYGLLAYIVQQRRKELGIRVALGATRADLGKMVLSDGLKMASAGALGCLLLIPAGGFLLRSFLYNVKSYDLFTIAAAPAVLLAVALLASLGPARTATRSDPALALRED